MFIEIAGPCLVIELRFLIDVFDALSGVRVGRSLVLLEAERASSYESGVSVAERSSSLITESSISSLASFAIFKRIANTTSHVSELQSGMLAGFESLHLPGGDGHVSSSVARLVIRIFPAARLILVVDDPLDAGLDTFLQVGEVDAELAAKCISFGKCIGSDCMRVAPVLVLQVGCHTALVLLAVIDQEGYRASYGDSKFNRKGGFAVAEVSEEDQSGVGNLCPSTPRAVSSLRVLKILQRLHDCFLTLLVPTVLLQALKAILWRASFSHCGGYISKSSTPAIATVSPSLTEIISAAKIKIWLSLCFWDRNGGWRWCAGRDHLGHGGAWRRGLTLNLGVNLFLFHVLLLRRASLVGHDGRRLDEQVWQENKEQDQDHERHDEKRYHDRGDDGVSLLRLKTCLCFLAELGVETHSGVGNG